MGGVRCSVYGCPSSSAYDKDAIFHRFPRDERQVETKGGFENGRFLWIEACRRPDLKEKPIQKLQNMYVCSQHFETWMYMKTKLKNAAIPVKNLPLASLHSMSTQTAPVKIEVLKDFTGMAPVKTEILVDLTDMAPVKTEIFEDLTDMAPVKTEILEDMTDTGVQKQIDVASLAESTSSQAKILTDHIPTKRKLGLEQTSCDKKLKEDTQSVDITREQFIKGCDKFLSPNLSTIVKFYLHNKKEK